jgi:hypothetical protein
VQLGVSTFTMPKQAAIRLNVLIDALRMWGELHLVHAPREHSATVLACVSEMLVINKSSATALHANSIPPSNRDFGMVKHRID